VSARPTGQTGGVAKRIDPKLAGGAVAAGAAAAVGAGEVARRLAKRRRVEAVRRFRLGDDESTADGVRRIARGQLELARKRLARRGHDDAGIHDARKSLKRVRALVRLSRDQLGDHAYRRENTILRDAGRRLSSVRDAAVLVETLDALVERYRDELPEGAFAGLREALERDARLARDHADQDPTATEEVAARLADARDRVATWPLDEQAGPAMLAPGLERIYRRGRRAARAVAAEPTTEALHELRKRAKDLWHAAQVLRPADPKRLKQMGRDAHALADLTGDDHDLAVLLEAAGEHPTVLEPGEPALLEGLIGRRRAKLQRRALKRARRVYARKPRAVAARIAG
jgi:CHAD domain-containing protein